MEKYNEETGLYECRLKNNTIVYLHRLLICIDAEDPRKYALRVANAFQKRV